MASNSWAVYSSCGDKHICRYEKNVEVQKETLPAHAMYMCADDAHVYILSNQNELLVLSAKDLSVKNQKKLAKPSTAIAVCGENIWVGDKSGSLTVLAASNLEEKNKLESVHNKEITCMTSNSKYVASGDARREFFVFNNED